MAMQANFENKESHHLEDIVLMAHSILRTNIKCIGSRSVIAWVSE